MIVRWVCPACARTVDGIMAEKPSCIKCHVRMHSYKIDERKPEPRERSRKTF